MKPAIVAQAPAPVDIQVAIPARAKDLSHSIAGRVARLKSRLSSNWTTRPNVEQSRDDLLLIAEEALELRRVLG